MSVKAILRYLSFRLLMCNCIFISLLWVMYESLLLNQLDPGIWLFWYAIEIWN